MFFFLQEKNNDDRVSFYTPQIISDMITQSVCDELDDSNVLIGKDRTLGRGIVGDGRVTGDIALPNGTYTSLNILISTSVENSGSNFSQVLYSHRELYSAAHIISSSLYDFGKIVAFNHEEKRPKLITDSLDKPKKGKSKIRAETNTLASPYIVILPLNLYSPNLLDYLRHNKILTESIAESLVEIVG